MHAFSTLLDRLVYTPSRNAKLKLISDYLRRTPDPDRGWAMAALTGELDLKAVKPKLIRTIVEERVDPVLFAMSRDYVGDLAETGALIWPRPAGLRDDDFDDISLSAVIDELMTLGRAEAPSRLAALLDRFDAPARYALLKLATGELRVGVSARLAKTALAQAFDIDVDEVESVWHGLEAPYLPLFAWGEKHAPQPSHRDRPVFRPFMLAHPLEDGHGLALADYAVEWKWDGIRVQIVRAGGETRLYSRAGDDVTRAFPDIADAVTTPGSFDGELLVRGTAQAGEAGSFNALQQRLNRKTVSDKALRDYPAFVRLYDLLLDGEEDMRAASWEERRARLESLADGLDPERFDVSQLIVASDFAELEEIRAGARDAAIEGLMLKRRDSAYVGGRRVGLWYKWKRDPLLADCVVMYAQRGHGKRSSFYSDYTFGCWTEDGELQPVGKAYSGITDQELAWLDRWVRGHTVQRFGPVREVEKSLVLEVAFDSIHLSKRHKSGLAMRFPRIARIRTDKPAAEADTVAALLRMVT